jgi:hypothetical protein
MIRITTNRQRATPLPRPPRRAILTAPAVIKVPVYTSHKMDDIKRDVTRKHGVSVEDIFSRSRVKHLVAARREFIQRLHHEMRWNATRIATHLQMDITTINHHLGLRRTSKVEYGALNDD